MKAKYTERPLEKKRRDVASKYFDNRQKKKDDQDEVMNEM